jgi:outer membrane protein assembly factor BamB
MEIVSMPSVATEISAVWMLRTGKIYWTLNVVEKFGGSNPHWGTSESPLILGDQLLVNAGGPSASIVALNKKDGSVIWKSGSDGAGIPQPYRLKSQAFPRRLLYAPASDGRGRPQWQPALGLFTSRQPHRQRRHSYCERQQGISLIGLRHRLCSAGDQAEGGKLKAQEIYFNQT